MADQNPAIQFLKQLQTSAGKSLVEAYAQHLLVGAGAYSFPVDLQRVIDHYEISVKTAPLPGQRGLITEDLEILYNSSDPRRVQLYSQAHELIELFFRALEEYDPPWLGDDEIRELIDRSEFFCECGAAELLMPMEFFLPLVKGTGLSLQTAQAIARDSGLSLTAVVRRMLETGLRECLFVIWKYDHKPSEFVASQVGQLPLWGPPTAMDPPKRLRVDYFYRSPTVDGYIKKDKSVESSTSVGQVVEAPSGTLVRGYDYLEIGPQPGFYLTESISVAFDGRPRAMSLIYFDDQADEQYRINPDVET